MSGLYNALFGRHENADKGFVQGFGEASLTQLDASKFNSGPWTWPEYTPMKTVKIAEPKPAPEDFARIVESIGRLADSAKAMRASGLSRDATVVLLKHATGIPMKDISAVLSAAEDLKRWCLSTR